jgi:pyruvate kinase
MKSKPVKIVATLGPVSHSPEMILELAKAGVDVFRISLTHALPQEVADRCQWIRTAEEQVGRPLAIMGDLGGPKIRIKNMKPETILEKGQKFLVSKKITVGDKKGCGLNYPSIVDVLQVGAEIFIDDGTIKLIVEKKLKDAVQTKVLVGGHLKPKKGFSAEGITLANTGVSENDKKGIELMLKNNADALAISFVQGAGDVLEVKKLLPKNTSMMLISKIETLEGVKHAEEIVEVSDGLMVARGDLGLAVPIAQVPFIQKELIDICVKNAKPVITATQMLESMISKPIPTRAEVTDVANAILDRTDAVMLSAETAVGKFAIETVEMMVKIIKESAQKVVIYEYNEKQTVGNAITDAVGNIADRVGAKLIIALTEGGRTARRISRHRHQEPIIALSPNPATIRKLNFVWGVYPQLIAHTEHFNDMLKQARKIAKAHPFEPLQEDDLYVISAGIPFGKSGATNMILVQKV